MFWIFDLGSAGVSLKRSFDHLLEAWVYVALGLVGGVVFSRCRQFDTVVGLWMVWLFLMLVEIYTSGIAFMTNHLGPGSLIATMWCVAAVASIWPADCKLGQGENAWGPWLRAGPSVGVMLLILNGMHVFRAPRAAGSPDAYRYIGQIEDEFEGFNPRTVLLDAGSWVYLEHGNLMKDRVPSIGQRGYSGTGDFSGIIERLKQRTYTKILVRRLHHPDFMYDWSSWPRRSGIKNALIQNYREVRRLPAVQHGYSLGARWHSPYFMWEISVLEPRRQKKKGDHVRAKETESLSPGEADIQGMEF